MEPEAMELTQAGTQLTEETLATLKDLESGDRGRVSLLIVFFEDDFPLDQLQYLEYEPRSLASRIERYRKAEEHANRVQSNVRFYLWNENDVKGCFRECPHFAFEPDRHIRLLPTINALIVPGTRILVEKLKTKPYVLAVDLDFPVDPIVDEITVDSEEIIALGKTAHPAAHKKGYTWGWNRLQIHKANEEGWRGEGVGVGVANTGACADHEDLIHKIKDYQAVQPSGHQAKGYSRDPVGHGTHVCGTIAGENNSGVWIGGAPRVDLKIVSVFYVDEDSGKVRSTAAMLLKALDWLASKDCGASVVNLSLGFRGAREARLRVFERAFQRVRQQQHVLCVAAAGNHATTPLYPAAFDSVISCGALMPPEEGKPEDVWEDSADDPHFVLPGVCVYSCVPHGLERFKGQKYAWMTGTSMAAAHMSALVALLMEKKPAVRPDEIVRAFLETASLYPNKDRRFGWGVPDLYEAYKAC